MSAQDFHGFTDGDVIRALAAASARSRDGGGDGWVLVAAFLAGVPTTQHYMDGAALTPTLRRLEQVGRIGIKKVGPRSLYALRVSESAGPVPVADSDRVSRDPLDYVPWYERYREARAELDLLRVEAADLKETATRYAQEWERALEALRGLLDAAEGVAAKRPVRNLDEAINHAHLVLSRAEGEDSDG